MNIIDSSAWLEYFAGSKQGDRFARVIENIEELLVPAIIIYEVFKKLLSLREENEALFFIAQMKQGRVVDLNFTLAIEAASISKEKKLPMADSIILATARKYKATIWTLDADFKGIRGVRYFPKN